MSDSSSYRNFQDGKLKTIQKGFRQRETELRKYYFEEKLRSIVFIEAIVFSFRLIFVKNNTNIKT